ncbi:DUF397 domain-containing protein [Streptomyces bambusae]|uniref:DUF397 domain-containing protein n=1 Tax=Streptomyces bambusae TaxID=1550616 RepID=A0ABS6Z0J1_9ACTN|nr:DUF397 domain-containing protein [Streptomyces bambusae]MBW5480336.1 DUF397 domain-containing protein [Streptomyces bambusae]
MRAIELSAVTWRKSSYSNPDGGQCVEVADGIAAGVPVRDSKIPDGPVIVFGASGWNSFVAALRDRQLSS